MASSHGFLPLLLFSSFSFLASCSPPLAPARGPALHDDVVSPSIRPPALLVDSPSESSALSPSVPESSPVPSPQTFEIFSPAPSPGVAMAPAPDSPVEKPVKPADLSTNTVTWCAVRDEYTDCQYFLSLLQPGDYEWSCLRKQTALDCMEAIRKKEADLIALDAGLAYIAFTNYSMKAIMAEEHCYHNSSYSAVAVVNKGVCDKNSKLRLENFRGLRSCHPGYRTAAGWNYPVHFLIDAGLQAPPMNEKENMQRDAAVISDFFAETCAPSEIEGTGLCTSCGNNGSCPSPSIYEGYSGAFRCLMEGVGDIAFLRSDTALRLSNDGFNAQDWSTKSVNEFMYLCPQGGCRAINDNIGSCSFGLVPANAIMTYNSQPNARRNVIVKTLLNASWTEALYSGKNWNDHLLSASAQNLVELKELTRLYLGDSAAVAQSVQSLQTTNFSSFPTSDCLSLISSSLTIIVTSLIATLLNHH